MTPPPRTLNHPTFGFCRLVPSLVAIKWVRPLDAKTISAVLRELSLTLAKEVPKFDRTAARSKRDPRPASINHSATLTWVSGKDFSDAALRRILGNENVQWVAPAYRADNAEPGPQSYFAINPSVLILTQAAMAALGGIASVDGAASIDQARTRLLKGLTVVNLPASNALTIAIQLSNMLTEKGLTGGVSLENIPYISPVCGYGCRADSEAFVGGRCSPSISVIVPSDTFYPSQWGLQRINAPRAWPLTEGDANVIVAVLDQGVELVHPDLNMWPISYSTITHTNDGSPVGNHGTACAGIIGAKIDNALGVSGLAGRCPVMAIATEFADTQIAEGLYFAADNGARIVSMSFGVYPSWMVWNFSIIEAALQYCEDRNLILVAASGNENQNACRFPGSDPRTICVGGSNRDDVRKAIGDNSAEPSWGACYGPALDVVAPCLEIPTTDRLGAAGYTPNDYNMHFNGTSSATPHVAALAGLIVSMNPALTNTAVRKIISETTDKINEGGYTYLPSAGKPYGTWNHEVGYGRINAERAVLVACALAERKAKDACGVRLPTPDACCISPCDPPWRPDEQCLVWYETRFFRDGIGREQPGSIARLPTASYIEFRITYEHRICLLGKQHGPLLYTVTLLPGEKVTLYHSDRFRRITSEQDRFSVQTTFMQFVSVIHQARLAGTLDALSERLANVKSGSSSFVGGGLAGLLGLQGGGTSTAINIMDHTVLHVGVVSDQFSQTLAQASQLTHAERSVVVSTYEESEARNVTARILQNDNACYPVTYFVRKILELYAVSTIVSDISYRIVATNLPSEWHSVHDIGWLSTALQTQIKNLLKLLPKVGDIVEKPKPISLPTDGTVYDPELAHCCSCEPERTAAIRVQLEKQKAEAIKACLETQILELELQRRRLLLQKGELAPFEGAAPLIAGPLT